MDKNLRGFNAAHGPHQELHVLLGFGEKEPLPDVRLHCPLPSPEGAGI